MLVEEMVDTIIMMDDGWWVRRLYVVALIGLPSFKFHDVGVEAGDDKGYSTMLESTHLITTSFCSSLCRLNRNWIFYN